MFCFSSSRLDAQFTKQDIVFLRKNSEQVKAEFGQIRLEQMRFAGLVDHAFVPHRRDNQCDACGLGQEQQRHTNRQERLL